MAEYTNPNYFYMKASFHLSYGLSLGLLASLLMSGVPLGQPQLAQAQQQRGPILIIHDCDSTKQPSVACTITPLNPAGVPLTGLGKDSFEVFDGDTKIDQFDVAALVNPKVSVSYMLVVDFGMIGRASLPTLKDASKEMLLSVTDSDRVAMIGINGPINPDLNKIDPSKESNFVEGNRRNDIINIITQLVAVNSTPLYDVVYKAVELTRRESKVGQRAVLVFSDGKDVKSSIYGADDSVALGRSNLVPVFTIGIGSALDENYLTRLATNTDGEYIRADVNGIRQKFQEIQSTLKTQYVLTLNTKADDAKPRKLKIKLNTKSGADEKTFDYAPKGAVAPAGPAALDIAIRVNGAPVGSNMPVLQRDAKVAVEVTPKNVTPARVDFILDNQPNPRDKAPYIFEFTASYAAGSKHELKIQAVTDPAKPDPALARTISIDMQSGSTAVTQVTPPCNDIVCLISNNILTIVGIALVLVGLITVLAIILLRKRKPAPAPENAGGINAGMTFLGGATNMDFGASSSNGGGGGTVVVREGGSTNLGTNLSSGVGMSNVAAPSTQVWKDSGAGGEEGPKTMVYRPGKAIFEILSGPSQGLRYEMGKPGEDMVMIGRKLSTGTSSAQIKVDSPYVSRQHANFIIEGDAVYIEDLNSSSGTKVNGVRISQRTLLAFGDIIEIADMRAELKRVK